MSSTWERKTGIDSATLQLNTLGGKRRVPIKNMLRPSLSDREKMQQNLSVGCVTIIWLCLATAPSHPNESRSLNTTERQHGSPALVEVVLVNAKALMAGKVGFWTECMCFYSEVRKISTSVDKSILTFEMCEDDRIPREPERWTSFTYKSRLGIHMSWSNIQHSRSDSFLLSSLLGSPSSCSMRLLLQV